MLATMLTNGGISEILVTDAAPTRQGWVAKPLGEYPDLYTAECALSAMFDGLRPVWPPPVGTHAVYYPGRLVPMDRRASIVFAQAAVMARVWESTTDEQIAALVAELASAAASNGEALCESVVLELAYEKRQAELDERDADWD